MGNVPDIRFEGFSDEWELRKLGDIYHKIRNAFVGTASPYYVESGHFYLESNNVKDGHINRNNEVFINDEFYEKQKDNWLHTGDLVMVQSGHVGHSAVIPEELNNTAAHALIIISNSKVNINPYFLNVEFQTLSKKKQIDVITKGNTIKHILASDMKEFEVTVPEISEQNEIASFFETLDETISLHQHKLDDLKSFKKAMLQKMFPRDGEKVPEIRFEGFEGEWEERKLGDICDRIVRKNKNNESDLPLTIASQYGLIDQRDFFNKVVAAKDMSNYYLLKKGEFAYNKSYSSGFDYGSIKRLNAYEQGCLSTLYICFGITSEDIESDYLECYFDTLNWYSDVSQICSEGARNHGLLNVDTKAFFEDVHIEMPSSKMEQKQISTFFYNIDKSIALLQNKLDGLNSLKQFFLQHMFPKEA